MPTNIGQRMEISREGIACIRDEDAHRLSRYLVRAGDIVYSRRGDVEKCAYITSDEDGWLCGTGCLRVRFSSRKANPRFYAYFLSTPEMKEWVVGHAVGTTMPNLNTSILGKMPVVLPSILEQEAIAEALGALDDKIRLLQRQNQTLEGMAECVFQSFFGEPSPEWPLVRLDAHTNAERGLSYKGAGLAEGGEGIPMHNLNSIFEGGGYKYSGIKWYTGEYKERHVLHPGDLIVANTEQGHEFRLIGFPAVIPDSYGPLGIFSQHLYKVSILPNSPLTTEFLFHLIRSPRVREQVVGATNGSTVNMLAIDGLQSTEFELPPAERIEAFTQVVRPLWVKGNENRNQIQVLTKTRDNLLPKLMSGEVRVNA